MLTLLIDTCTERSVVALLRDSVIEAANELPAGLHGSQSLLPAIEQLLLSQELSTRQLELLVVGSGPGSYTGIRVGVSAAQAIAYAHSIPVIGMSTLYGLVPEFDCAFAALIDAKIGGAYYLFGQITAGRISWDGESNVAPLSDLVPRLASVDVIVTPLAQRLQQQLPGPWQWIERAPDPIQLVQRATDLFQKGQFNRNGQIEILYLRKSQAEIDRQK